MKTKFLLERLVRKFGWDFVSSLVPNTDYNMHKRLKNMRKELARRARGKEEDSGADDEDLSVGAKKQKTMEEILADSSDEDMEEDADQDRARSKKDKTKKGRETWIKEGGDEVVDLLSSNAAQAVSSTNPKTAKSLAEKPAKKKEAFKVSNDGKLIINDDSSDDDGDDGPKKRSARAMANKAEDSDDEEETFDSLVSGKRRKTGASEAGSQKSAMSGISSKSAFSKYAPSGSGIHRNTKEAGAEFRAKSGKGDVKRKGAKHDPYAYIPMTHKALNKRKQSKAAGQFASVISAAKKGSKAGHKSKVKEVKSLMKKMKV